MNISVTELFAFLTVFNLGQAVTLWMVFRILEYGSARSGHPQVLALPTEPVLHLPSFNRPRFGRDLVPAMPTELVPF